MAAQPILCLVTDRNSLARSLGERREDALLRQIEAAAATGISWIQIREKDLEAQPLLELTRRAITATRETASGSVPRILVNDRADVAWAAKADGVHLGEASMPVSPVAEDARGNRRDFLVGASCHSLPGAIQAAGDGADYLFFGPVFATPSKAKFGPPQGVAILAEVCAAVNVPVLAIGGITPDNVRVCADAGAAGIAAIRLFQHLPQLQSVVHDIRSALDAR